MRKGVPAVASFVGLGALAGAAALALFVLALHSSPARAAAADTPTLFQ